MKISLNQQIVIGAIVGVAGGFLLALPALGGIRMPVLNAADIVGDVFISLLKMVLIPLIFSSIAVGICNLQSHHQMKKVWVYTLVYFICSTALATLLGLIVVNIFKPGVGLQNIPFANAMNQVATVELTPLQFFKSFATGLFANPIAAMARGDVLATVTFAFFLGIAMIAIGERTRQLQNILNEIFDVIMLIVGWIMRLAPFGIAALLLKLMATQNTALFGAMGKFMVIVVGATLFHGFVVLPLILYVVTRKSPLYFFNGFKEALITAFSTSSSSATLPVSLRCAQENLKIEKEICGFVMPLGATVNMDGTALYEAVAAVFVANIVGIDLSLGQQIIVFLTAILASIGAPGIPSAGMVTMIMVLQAVGLPAEAIAILLPVDRLLDTVRTMVNVEGDGIGSLIVSHLTKK